MSIKTPILDDKRILISDPSENSDKKEKSEEQTMFNPITETSENIASLRIKRILSPEQTEALLGILKERFEGKKDLSLKNVEWTVVENALKANKLQLWSLFRMEETGGEPALVEYDRQMDVYTFVDCSKETPIGRRNVVFNKQGENILRSERPNDVINGNAVDMAESMGISLLTRDEYQRFLESGLFDDKNSSSCIDSDTNQYNLRYENASNSDGSARAINTHSDTIGFRGSLLLRGLKRKINISSPESQEIFIGILQKRFESNMKRHKNIEWSRVCAKLRENPGKLMSLYEMEITGGKPDVIDYDVKTGEFIFVDCSLESPDGRRGLPYNRAGEEANKENPYKKIKEEDKATEDDEDNLVITSGNAVDKAKKMGIEILNLEQYLQLQKLGEFDCWTRSWIKPDPDEESKCFNTGIKWQTSFTKGCRLPKTERDVDTTDYEIGFRGLLRV
jgi:hypothetical protein